MYGHNSLHPFSTTLCPSSPDNFIMREGFITTNVRVMLSCTGIIHYTLLTTPRTFQSFINVHYYTLLTTPQITNPITNF